MLLLEEELPIQIGCVNSVQVNLCKLVKIKGSKAQFQCFETQRVPSFSKAHNLFLQRQPSAPWTGISFLLRGLQEIAPGRQGVCYSSCLQKNPTGNSFWSQMESVLPLAVETFLLLFLRKRPTLLIVVAAVAILFVPIPDNASNLKLQKFYGDKTTMKAAVYVPNGGRDYTILFLELFSDFEVTQVPLPQFHNTLLESVTRVKATQLLIRVKAAAINPVDFKLRLPTLPILRWFIPNSVGRDFSGVVEMVIAGDDECTFRPGDEIFGVSACVLPPL